MTIYADYQRDRIGWFFGLSGGQLMFLALASLPAFWAISRGAWFSAFLFALVWAVPAGITVVPVRGRSATGWVFASTTYAVGGLLGWTSFRAKATAGPRPRTSTPRTCPGCCRASRSTTARRTAPSCSGSRVIQDHATKTWAVTASIVHPGIGMEDAEERDRYGEALAGLLDVAGRTEKIDEILFMVRTVPEDGAERDLWVNSHRRPNAPQLAESSTATSPTGSPRHRCAPSSSSPSWSPRPGSPGRPRSPAAASRAAAASSTCSWPRSRPSCAGPMGMTSVRWLTCPELALACRTGFAPGDRAGIVEALAMREKDPGVNADVPWAMAGPSGADATVRHYSHDAWNSISATIKLPDPRRGDGRPGADPHPERVR